MWKGDALRQLISKRKRTNQIPHSRNTALEKKAVMKDAKANKALSAEQREALLRALKARFEKNLNRHQGLEWAKVRARLDANAEKLWSLNEMEKTGGEPDVVGHDKKTGEY